LVYGNGNVRPRQHSRPWDDVLVSLGGCAPSGHDVTTPDPLTVYQLRADEAAPPPQEETHVQRPGSLFVGGHWSWDDGEWVWRITGGTACGSKAIGCSARARRANA
jgi:hypothetical protein